MAENTVARIMKEHGLTLVDAKKPLHIEVKKCDTKARRQQPNDCAFARACKRGNKSISTVVFLRSMAYIEDGKHLWRWRLPSDVRNEIMAFDRGGRIQPGKYVLQPPTPGSTLKAMKRMNKRRKVGVQARSYKRIADIRTITFEP